MWKSFTRGYNPILMEMHQTNPMGDARAGLVAARIAMGHTRGYSRKMDLAAATPRDDLSSTRYCLATPGKEYLVYLPEGGEVTVDLSAAAGSLAVEWFNPMTGAGNQGPMAQGGGKRSLTAPFEGEAVLYLSVDSAGGSRTRVAPKGRMVYLSDLPWVSAENGWGPVEKDMSVGQTRARDGRKLTIEGRTFAKGIGVHSPSDIRYALDGSYDTFEAEIGVDDEIRNPFFEADHGDWADARLIGRDGLLAVFVSELTWLSATSGYGPAERDTSNGGERARDGRTIKLDGRTYAKGLGVHAPSELRYELGGKYKTFSADIGIDDEVGNKGAMTFEVWGDGAKLYDSGIMRGMSKTKTVDVSVAGVNELRLVATEGGKHEGAVTFQVWGDGAKLYDSGLVDGSMPAQPIKVKVTGVKDLRLIVTDGDGNIMCDHADWADARLISEYN